ncbi:MAG: N-acetylmuramoyl-L-alanine amidase [Actinomycetales bacterium]
MAGLVLAPVTVLPGPVAQAVTPTVAHRDLHGVSQAAKAKLEAGQGVASMHGEPPVSVDDTIALTDPTTADPFDLVAVTWDDPEISADTTTVSIRVRENGRWTDWFGLTEDSDDGPDPGSQDALGARGGSAPLLATSADAYQVKVDDVHGATPAGLRIDTIAAGRSAADGRTPAQPAATADAMGVQPPIISRAQWGADESLRSGSPSYSSELKVGVVHHTDSTNSYSATQAAAQVRAIYAFHTKTRGWSDIGYNFLVDRFGRVYEGRYGGIDRAVIGAHAGGYNTNTFGVSVLGSYTSTSVPRDVLTGLSGILSWKMAANAINPFGASYLTSSGGGTARWPAGDTRAFANLIGHRDTGLTSCPGDRLYSLLGQLKASVAANMLGTVPRPPGTPTGPTMSSGQRLGESAMLSSANGQHYLTTGGYAGEQFGLVLASPACTGQVLASLGRPAPGGHWNNELIMQSDGNLVLYSNGAATWATGTSGNPGAKAVLQDDRNLVVYSRSGQPLWASGVACDQARVGTTGFLQMYPGHVMYSPNRAYRLVMQKDGNLVLYSPRRAIWSTGTSGRNGASLVVQNDGNLVLYTSSAHWSSGTSVGSLLTDLTIQNDGNVVLYTQTPGYRAVWNTRTAGVS